MATQTTRARELESKRKEQASKLLEAAYVMALDPNIGENARTGAMKLFLSKVLPDLKSVDIKADVDMEVRAIEIQVVDADDQAPGT
jgi:hypothetical protein